MYDIEKLLNTIVKVEPPRHKKEIPQCIRCQQYGHTKNYCNRTPACVKCAKNHLTTHLIKSYLSSRTFLIKIKDTHSQVKDTKAGVPQGSVLGPILYTLYTANIPTTTNSTVLTFADDTTILVRHTNPETAVKLQQEHITKIEKWLQEKQIKANPNKCNHITFTLRKKIPPIILLNGMHITQTKHVKYLGLHLDTQLTCKLHIKSIVEKIQTTRKQMHWLTSRKSKLSIGNNLKYIKRS